MESLSFYVGVIGNIISVLLFLSPLGTFLRIVKHRSTEEFESFPYICTLLSSSLWTYYGITKPGSYLVATVNSFGVVVEVIYVSLFLLYAPPRMKNRSTEEFESFPYICTLLSSSLWTYYGITKPGSYLVATVNSFGVVVEVIYVSLFLLYAPPRMKAKTATLAGILNVGFPVAAILVTYLGMQGDLRIDVIGFMCAGLNIVMYASPLAAMVRS
ncbi:hypothetical protein TEA_013379 [Camellia sinensis var. sinensis]|uniref:Bidirectional sugar transporter SWEET n=1 Tax=Camellia sinensis var. sinensis TaxID=542762 RepID=A0A4S4CYC2_CAMSN|nr:hypothetical protein TEA_013379 [Camellia sinensis var. sinensis]